MNTQTNPPTSTRAVVLLTLIMLLTACTQSTAPVAIHSGDFLSQWKLGKPETLIFVDYEYRASQQGQQTATYQVNGQSAAQVETWLRDRFDMSPLRFVCCTWEANVENDNIPGRGHHLDDRGRLFEIAMYSSETLVHDRQEWPQINAFIVQVTHYSAI